MLHGVYFDGLSSKPHKAEIRATDLYIIIDLIEEEKIRTVKWVHENVHTADIPGSSKVSVNYGEYPHQSIEVNANDFFALIKSVYPAAHYIKTPNNFFLSKGSKWLIGFGITFIAAIVMFYFFLLPLAANLVVSLIPIDTEISLGKQMSEGMLASEKVDDEKTKAINAFYKNLKTKSNYPIHITVVDSEVKNAFAVPGGQIVVYTGLLNEMEDYSELVALLGHEKAHVEERHSLQMLAKSLGLYIVVSLVFQDINGIMAVLVDNASSLQQLSYNRNLESEADEIGLKLVMENKVDPKGMVELFNHLKSNEGDYSIPEFLSTHPNLDNRINSLKEKLPELKYEIIPNPNLKAQWEKLKKSK
jgi:beta-barrel assembly-enhancing protease